MAVIRASFYKRFRASKLNTILKCLKICLTAFRSVGLYMPAASTLTVTACKATAIRMKYPWIIEGGRVTAFIHLCEIWKKLAGWCGSMQICTNILHPWKWNKLLRWELRIKKQEPVLNGSDKRERKNKKIKKRNNKSEQWEMFFAAKLFQDYSMSCER